MDCGFSDEEKLKQVVQQEIDIKSEEEKNLEDREHNIIIYKTPERKTENIAERNSNDAVFVRDLCDGVFDMKVEAADIERCTDLVVGLKASQDHCSLHLKIKK